MKPVYGFILSGLFRQWDLYCAYMSMTGHIIQVKEHKNKLAAH